MHLFAGAGGGLLADLILGHEPVVAVEWDKYCCRVLRDRAADGWFPDLHVWEGDVRLFDPSEYAGRVDVIHAGFPCQDISGAGNQAGLSDGTRSGLYREVLRIADIVRPRYLFMENVSAIIANEWLGTVLRDLAARGYDARWTCIPASAAGAPHYRDRWWLLAERAYAKGVGSQGGQASSVDAEGNRSRLQPKSSRMGGGYAEDVADASRGRCAQPERWQVEQPGRAKAVCTSKDVADPMRQCIQGEQPSGAYENGREGSERGSLGSRGNGLGWWSTEPGLGLLVDGFSSGVVRGGEKVNGEKTRCDQTLQSVRSINDSKTLQRPPRKKREGSSREDAMFGWWELEPTIGRVADGIPNRAHRIKALGNAQVPIQAALAWMMLGGPI